MAIDKLASEEKPSKCYLLLQFMIGLVIGVFLAIVISFWAPYCLEFIQANTNGKQIRLIVEKNENTSTSIPTDLSQEVRVFCWVLTKRKHHKTRAQHIKRTWGRRCNKLIFISTQYDEELGSVTVTEQKNSRNAWPKAQAALQYIYTHHLDDAEWFFRVDDKAYAVMENMRSFLYNYSSESPIYFGHKVKDHISADAGYVLSKEALRRFVEKALPNTTYCAQNSSRTETIELAQCLGSVEVIAGDSRDQQGCVRFVPLHLRKHLMPVRRNQDISESEESWTCCSATAIVYNYIAPHEMYGLDHFIYHVRTTGVGSTTTTSLPLNLNQSETKTFKSNETVAPINGKYRKTSTIVN
uniref:N-acetylgalactosaminide beta-1,3-galactosyltransferase n=1 Tax=Zeugodacus cucurbitae TaxID=28588 RepID=A0A0A1WFK1_ZEUCU